MSHDEKFCIFCGGKPKNKTNEHVLPKWLIAMTGDPKRVVNFGVDPKTGKAPRFDWSSFVFPSCSACNERYSALEGETKEIVKKLVIREAVKANDYVTLLDWLDKVRIGLWLGYSYLHKNPTGISPTFHIDTRIAAKDRMLAVYTLATDKDGLNAHGAETLCFQTQPSCFSLKVNSIYILNMSWDFMCSARCGFPFPRTSFINLDLDKDATYECRDFQLSHKVKHPILRTNIIKPSIHLYEPIIQEPVTISDYPEDEWLKSNLIPGTKKKGIIYRQWDDRVERITDQETFIENDNVTGHHCKPLKDIVAQTYDLQLDCCLGYQYISKDNDKIGYIKKRNAILRKQNNVYRNAFRNWS